MTTEVITQAPDRESGSSPRVSDHDLLAFVEGRLCAEDRERIESALDRSPADRELVAQLARIFRSPTAPVYDTSTAVESRFGADGPPSGTQLGRYMVIDELGRGGMGVVLRAYDPHLEREVALKCLRPSLLFAETQSRLIREAQAMAKLSHRNVVAVYDVDVLDDRLMVAMEYIEGMNLGEWLHTTPRSWREVIDVFLEAGQGLVAAHDAGMLHCDFKPANVLISTRGEVKVTDFGVARFEDPIAQPDGSGVGAPTLPDSPFAGPCNTGLLTENGQMMGTPAYMSPEQFEGEGLTTAADQYAFCASLWEALVGSVPFIAEMFSGDVSLSGLIRLKHERSPRWPSSVDVPRHLSDAIIRGLHSDPAQRWSSMSALLVELRVDHEGRRPSKVVVGALAAVLAGGLGWYGVDRTLVQIGCEREGQALQAQWGPTPSASIATAFAETNIPYATDTWERATPRVDSFVDQWSEVRTQVCLDGQRAEGGALNPRLVELARACLDEQRVILERFIEQWSDPHRVVVERAAAAAWSLPAPELCTDEVVLARRDDWSNDPATAQLGYSLQEQIAGAMALERAGEFEAALARAESIFAKRSDRWPARVVVLVQQVMADALYSLGHYEEAAEVMESAFHEASLHGDDEGALRAANFLTLVAANRLAHPEHARRWHRFAQMSERRLGLADDHPDRAFSVNNEGILLRLAGDYANSLQAHRHALAIREAALGPDHPEIAKILNEIGTVHIAQGSYEAALEAHRRELAILENSVGPEHSDIAFTLNSLGNIYLTQGRFDQGLQMHKRALAIREAALVANHADLAVTLSNIGNAYTELERYERALQTHQRALTILESSVGPTHPDLVAAHSNRGDVYRAMGQWDKARSAYERSLALCEQSGPCTSLPRFGLALSQLGTVLKELGEYEQALELYDRALVVWEPLGPQHPHVLRVLINRGEVLHGLGRYDEALISYERASQSDHSQVGTESLGRRRAADVVGEQ